MEAGAGPAERGVGAAFFAFLPGIRGWDRGLTREFAGKRVRVLRVVGASSVRRPVQEGCTDRGCLRRSSGRGTQPDHAHQTAPTNNCPHQTPPIPQPAHTHTHPHRSSGRNAQPNHAHQTAPTNSCLRQGTFHLLTQTGTTSPNITPNQRSLLPRPTVPEGWHPARPRSSGSADQRLLAPGRLPTAYPRTVLSASGAPGGAPLYSPERRGPDGRAGPVTGANPGRRTR